MDCKPFEGALAPYQLLEAVRRTVWTPEDPLEFFNTRSCLLNLRPINDFARVQWIDPCEHYAAGRARLHGTIPCNSVWSCAVCASRISAQRAIDLAECIEAWSRRGGHVLLATLTNPHTRADELKDLLDKQAKAWTQFRWNKNLYRKFLPSIGFFGGVRATEITFGNAYGAHPHFHWLMFVDKTANPDRVRHELFTAWAQASINNDLNPPLYDFVDVRDGLLASQYVNKLAKDLSAELALGDRKTGRKNGVTAFGLIALKRFRQFRDHHIATFRRPKLLGLGPLQKKLGLSHLSDEDIDDQDTELYRTVLTIERLGWRTFLGNGGTVPELLNIVYRAGGDTTRAKTYLASLIDLPLEQETVK